MRSRSDFQTFLHDLSSDFQDVRILWQFATLALAIGIAWWLDRRLRPRLKGSEGAWKLGAGGVRRVIFPASALVVVSALRFALKGFMPVHLLDLAVPLLVAMAGIRLIVYMLRQVFAQGGMLAGAERAIAWGVWILVALYLTGLGAEFGDFLDDVAFHVGRQRISLLLILHGLLTVAVTLLVTLWLGSALERRIMGVQTLDMSLRVVLTKILRAGVIVVGVLIALPLVGIDLTV
ncbi:MAG TPA: hypothetical protein VF859_09160, partial [Burkholderiales bacterium]